MSQKGYAEGGVIPEGPSYQGYKPLEILLPEDGFHKGVLWAGLADNWKHQISARISDGKFLTSQWKGCLMNSSSN